MNKLVLMLLDCNSVLPDPGSQKRFSVKMIREEYFHFNVLYNCQHSI